MNCGWQERLEIEHTKSLLLLKIHFSRLSRNTFTYLHDLIQEDLVRHVPGCPTIPSHHQLIIALWKIATMDSYRSLLIKNKILWIYLYYNWETLNKIIIFFFYLYYRSVCDRFNVGRATAVRAVRRVCHALFITSSRFIQWPTEDW